MKTRTSAQVRSHAQKYVIKLCKKYDIEIRSKRKSCFLSNHLNFPYKRKNKKNILPLEKMSKDDKKILKNFNFYIKLVEFDKVQEVDSAEEKVFKIDKSTKKNEENANNNFFSNSFPTTKQDENFEENSEVSSTFKLNLNANNVKNTTTANNNLINNCNYGSNSNFNNFANYNNSNKNNNNFYNHKSFSNQVLPNSNQNYKCNSESNGFGFGNMYMNNNLADYENNVDDNNFICSNKNLDAKNKFVSSNIRDLFINNLVNISLLRKASCEETFSNEYFSCLEFFREKFYSEANQLNKGN